MAELAVRLPGLELKNPLIPASGTFGYGMDLLDFWDPNLAGSFSIKGTTIEPRDGNPLPRIAESASGMLNAVGLQNPGAREVREKIFPELKKIYRGKVLANVSGFSVEGYRECAGILAGDDIVGAIELNISCPNVHGGGMSFGTDPKTACEVLRAVKEVTDKPVYVKCTPQCPDLVGMCVSLEQAGADGLVLLNTWLGMRLNFRTGKPVLANVTGGVSGPAVFPQTLYRVYQVYPKVSIPIIGCGGISSARDVIEMMSAGASAVEIGTQSLIDPLCVPRILEELPVLLDGLGIDSIAQITGRAHR
ncbi:MAG: dihydroorotate dehydrogenase [Firmicutes bacterium]|nr:dihydroorotate dehydrogenase [Bacillota bacterium]